MGCERTPSSPGGAVAATRTEVAADVPVADSPSPSRGATPILALDRDGNVDAPSEAEARARRAAQGDVLPVNPDSADARGIQPLGARTIPPPPEGHPSAPDLWNGR